MVPKFAGIYAIVNLNNGKFYLGSAVNIYQRWAGHRSNLRKGTHHSAILQNAWNKHGPEAFQFVVIERIDDVTQLIPIEQEYLDGCHPDYNVSPTAGNCLGVKHTAATKAKLSAARKGRPAWNKGIPRDPEVTAKIVAKITGIKGRKVSEQFRGRPSPLIGRTLTEEHKAKLSLAGKGRPHSEEHKAKIGAAHKGKVQPWVAERNRSPEARAATSKAHKGIAKPYVIEMNRNPEIRAKMAATRTGKHYPKMSEAIKAWHARRKLEKLQTTLKDVQQLNLWDEDAG